MSGTGAYVVLTRCNSIFASLRWHCLMWPSFAPTKLLNGVRKKGLSTEELLVSQHIEKSGNMGGSAGQEGSLTPDP